MAAPPRAAVVVHTPARRVAAPRVLEGGGTVDTAIARWRLHYRRGGGAAGSGPTRSTGTTASGSGPTSPATPQGVEDDTQALPPMPPRAAPPPPLPALPPAPWGGGDTLRAAVAARYGEATAAAAVDDDAPSTFPLTACPPLWRLAVDAYLAAMPARRTAHLTAPGALFLAWKATAKASAARRRALTGFVASYRMRHAAPFFRAWYNVALARAHATRVRAARVFGALAGYARARAAATLRRTAADDAWRRRVVGGMLARWRVMTAAHGPERNAHTAAVLHLRFWRLRSGIKVWRRAAAARADDAALTTAADALYCAHRKYAAVAAWRWWARAAHAARIVSASIAIKAARRVWAVWHAAARRRVAARRAAAHIEASVVARTRATCWRQWRTAAGEGRALAAAAALRRAHLMARPLRAWVAWTRQRWHLRAAAGGVLTTRYQRLAHGALRVWYTRYLHAVATRAVVATTRTSRLAAAVRAWRDAVARRAAGADRVAAAAAACTAHRIARALARWRAAARATAPLRAAAAAAPLLATAAALRRWRLWAGKRGHVRRVAAAATARLDAWAARGAARRSLRQWARNASRLRHLRCAHDAVAHCVQLRQLSNVVVATKALAGKLALLSGAATLLAMQREVRQARRILQAWRRRTFREEELRAAVARRSASRAWRAMTSVIDKRADRAAVVSALVEAGHAATLRKVWSAWENHTAASVARAILYTSLDSFARFSARRTAVAHWAAATARARDRDFRGAAVGAMVARRTAHRALHAWVAVLLRRLAVLAKRTPSAPTFIAGGNGGGGRRVAGGKGGSGSGSERAASLAAALGGRPLRSAPLLAPVELEGGLTGVFDVAAADTGMALLGTVIGVAEGAATPASLTAWDIVARDAAVRAAAAAQLAARPSTAVWQRGLSAPASPQQAVPEAAPQPLPPLPSLPAPAAPIAPPVADGVEALRQALGAALFSTDGSGDGDGDAPPLPPSPEAAAPVHRGSRRLRTFHALAKRVPRGAVLGGGDSGNDGGDGDASPPVVAELPRGGEPAGGLQSTTPAGVVVDDGSAGIGVADSDSDDDAAAAAHPITEHATSSAVLAAASAFFAVGAGAAPAAGGGGDSETTGSRTARRSSTTVTEEQLAALAAMLAADEQDGGSGGGRASGNGGGARAPVASLRRAPAAASTRARRPSMASIASSIADDASSVVA